MYPKDFLLLFYRKMLLIRQCEESLVDFIASGEIKCPVHLCSGQEAVAVGVMAALQGGDMVFGNHRSHGHYLAKTGDLKGLIAEVFCRESGCSRGRGGSMHLYNAPRGFLGSAPIVGGTVALAVGAALASSARNDRSVAVSFFGDGATGEGVLYESLNLAALKRLPVFFVCENNLYSTHMPIAECRADTRIHASIEPFGVQTHVVDGNDVLAVYETARNAVEHCRSGAGPVFAECLTYRLRGHVGPDDKIQGTRTDIRPQAEMAYWRKKDPIQQYQSYLSAQGILTNGDAAEISESVNENILAAIKEARASRFPIKEGVGDHVFADTKSQIQPGN